MSTVSPKAISVQIITPMPGVTRKFPLFDAATMLGSPAIALAQEERDEAEDEGVEDDRLRESESEPLDRGDLVAHLRLARDRLDHLAEDVADSHARADGAEPGADAERDRLDGLGGVGTAARLRNQLVGDRHERLLLVLGDGA